MSDPDMLDFARIFAANLQRNLADFSAVDSTLTLNFVSDLTAKISTAEEIEPDEIVTDRQVQLTESIKTAFAECRTYYKLIIYFAKQAFPKSPLIRNEFGENDYADVKDSHSRMIMFMKNLAGVIQKYRTVLTEAGASSELLNKVHTLQLALVEKNSEQELYKGNRPLITNNRISANNAVWEKIQRVSELAKIIYADDYPKVNLFLLPQRSASKSSDGTTIEAHQSLIAEPEGVEADVLIKLKNEGTVPLLFAVSDAKTDTPPENAVTLAAGEEASYPAATVSNGTYGILSVYNLNNAPGKFKVTLLS